MSETKSDKWERGKTLMLESLHKPDDRLRGCSHNQQCYHELMEIRDQVIEMVRDIPNPYAPKLKAGDKNNLPPVKSINGISVILLGGALGDHYREGWSEEHLNEWREYSNGI